MEYPRVVIALQKKAGLVWDGSFSTCKAEEILKLLQEKISASGDAKKRLPENIHLP